jgi:hypothetical protein
MDDEVLHLDLFQALEEAFGILLLLALDGGRRFDGRT